MAPYPAACVHMGKTCKCYSQQATLLQVSGAVCLQIVAQGFFVDWQDRQGQEGQRGRRSAFPDRERARQEAPAQQARTIPMPAFQDPDPGRITQADIPQALGIKNPAFNVFPHSRGMEGG